MANDRLHWDLSIIVRWVFANGILTFAPRPIRLVRFHDFQPYLSWSASGCADPKQEL